MVTRVLLAKILLVMFIVSAASIASADLLSMDDFNVDTGILYAEGDQGIFETSETTDAYGGPLAGITNRSVTIFSDTAPATGQITGGEFLFESFTNDSAGQVGYELSSGTFPINTIGDGLYVDVTGLTPDSNFAVTFIVGGYDENLNQLLASSTVFFDGAGVHSALFSSFNDLDPGNPVDFSEISAFGFVIENLDNSSATVAIGSTGVVSIPEPTATLAVTAILLGTCLSRRRTPKRLE